MRRAGCVVLFGLLAAIGCGASLTAEQATQLRHQLRDAMQTDVSTREQRDDQSRLLLDVVDKGALSGLSRDEVRAALGPGAACRDELCSAHGFSESDWYYEIGHVDPAARERIKQLPVLIVGFDPHERATRVWTLKTH
jgi:hypothetical protein